MAVAPSFRDLKVWRESMLLVEELYALTRQFPPDERFGLVAQLRRAAVSVPSNIGEGSRRKRRKSLLYFLEVALGSQGELDVQLELAYRLHFCTHEDYERLSKRVDAVGRMLNGLITALQPDRDRY